MNIGIAYADKFKQVWLKLDIPEGSTVQQAIEKSGLLEQFPEINLKRQKVGIFGKIIRLDTPLGWKSTDPSSPIRRQWSDVTTGNQRRRSFTRSANTSDLKVDINTHTPHIIPCLTREYWRSLSVRMRLRPALATWMRYILDGGTSRI